MPAEAFESSVEDMTKLNIGCGFAYRPGYVNIDKHELSVADMSADASDLPFDPNSVESIEAVQLLEHFDLLHSKYVLSEWFRVLRPEGELSIETPDLKASVKRFVSAKKDEDEAMTQWLFGIDSPGLQHKGVLTFELLKRVLVDIGFEDVRRMRSRTHKYAPGMRVECRKPADPGMSQFVASFRKRVKKKLGVDDSFVLIPLEHELRKLRQVLCSANRLGNEEIRSITSLACVWNPTIALAFLEECLDSGLLARPESLRHTAVCVHLVEIKFHQRVLTLWMKSRKTQSAEKEFQSLVDRMARLVNDMLEKPDRQKELLEYVISLDPTPIEVLDIVLVRQKANATLNKGIQQFHKGDLHGAGEHIAASLRLDPENTAALWNSARLAVATGLDDEITRTRYAVAISSTNDSKVKKRLREELNVARTGRGKNLLGGPVSEHDLCE